MKAVVRRTIWPFVEIRDRNHKGEYAKPRPKHPFALNTNISSTPELLPFAHYTLALFLILTLSSHVQIALRFATQGTLPVVWWSAAKLVEERKCSHIGRVTLKTISTFSLAWQTLSVVLSAGFYPPA